MYYWSSNICFLDSNVVRHCMYSSLETTGLDGGGEANKISVNVTWHLFHEQGKKKDEKNQTPPPTC